MAIILHPGKYLEQALIEKGMTQEELAELIDKPKSKISLIISGKASITADWAVTLGMVFGNEKHAISEENERKLTAENWLYLQGLYDLEKAKRLQGYDEEDVKIKTELIERIPLRELTKRGYIDKETSGKKTLQHLLTLFEVKNIDEIFDCYATFRRTEIFEYNENNMKVRLKLAEVKVDTDKLGRYDKDGLIDFVNHISPLTLLGEEGIKEVASKLNDLGVGFVLLRHFEKTRVDGATFWHKKADRPIVVLSLRYDRVNNFWFTLTHELAHIILHEKILKEKAIIEEASIDKDVKSIEKEANEFASSKLINPILWRNILLGPLTALRISRMAYLYNIHPALIVGRLQHEEFIDFSQLSRITNEKVIIPPKMQLP